MTGAAGPSGPLRALIADDERLLREQLKARLARVWPGLELCGEARDGLEAVAMAQALRPDVAFLDIFYIIIKFYFDNVFYNMYNSS